MKKFLSFGLVFCLVIASFLFVGCGVEDITLQGGPAYEETISGNGGLEVRKGDYVYFANGYAQSTALGATISNDKGSVSNGGLYRAKVVAHTKINDDQSETVSYAFENVELMVSKIAGWEKGGLYIFKDKIYFSTPTTDRDGSGIRYDLPTFYSCNLDGSNLTKFYQATEYGASATFSMTMIDGEVFLLVFDGEDIIRVNQKGEAKTLATKVSDVVLPCRKNISNNEENPSAVECHVYYTVKKDSVEGIDLGTVLYKKEINTENETKLFDVDYITFNLLNIDDGMIFYTRNSTASKNTSSYYCNTLSDATFTNSETRLTIVEYSNFIVLGKKANDNLGIAFTSGTTLYTKTLTSSSTFKKIADSVTTVVASKNGYVFYISSDYLYCTDTTATTPKTKQISTTIKPATFGYDIDDEYFYFYVENTEVSTGYVMYKVALDGVLENPVLEEIK